MSEKTEKLEKCNATLSQLQADFDNWKSHFIDISNYLMTRKGRFLGVDTKANDGSKRNSKVIDSTGGRALRVLAAGLQGGLTSPARPWFKLGLPDKDLMEYGPVKNWVEEVRKLLLYMFSQCNIYNALHSMYGELGGFGTAAMIVEEDFKTVMRCYPFTIGEYVISTNQYMRVDTLGRIYYDTARNIIDQFGKENVSVQIKNAVDTKNENAWFQVAHLIQPNKDMKRGKKDSANMPYSSVYWEYKGGSGNENVFLKESGYEMFPIMAPRWDVTGSEVYGRSPGMEVLGDVKMLQKMQEKSLKALDKVVDPPMNADSSLKNEHKTTIPGGVTYVDPQRQNTFSPTYQINPDIQAIEYKIQNVQNAIREGFFNDLFLMLAGSANKNMTATEVVERHEEKLLMVGPVIERLQPELLDPIIDRGYDILERNNLLPEPPEELQGMEIQVEYISLLAQAQKMVGTTAIEQTVAFIGDMATVKPEALYKLNVDEAINQYSDMVGSPPSIVVPDDIAEANRQADLEAAQQQQQQEQMQQAIEGAKTLSETDTGDNNALAALMGEGGR